MYVTDFVPVKDLHKAVIAHPSAHIRDKAILSKLNSLCEAVDKNMKAYLFGAIVEQLYSFFLYDFCDVYLELVKPCVSDSSAENADSRWCAQATLYTCLEHYLRLCHPMMPFVTEELWQRLPSISSIAQGESIMINPYPFSDTECEDTASEEKLEVIMSMVKAARFMRVEFNVPTTSKPNFYYISTTPETTATVEAQLDNFITLSKCGSLVAVGSIEEAPKGCGAKVVSDSVTLLVDLMGSIDVDKEVQRLEGEQLRLEGAAEKIRAQERDPSYEKVPEKVRDNNTSKLSAFESELAATITALENMKAMM